MFVYTIIIIYIKLMIPYKLFNLFLVGYYLEVKMTSLWKQTQQTSTCIYSLKIS